MSLVDVEQRLASLEASLRRVRAMPGAAQLGYPRPAATTRRTCDECHRRLPLVAFAEDTETCTGCETELATPRDRPR